MFISKLPNGTIRLSPDRVNDGLEEIEYEGFPEGRCDIVDGKVVVIPEQEPDIPKTPTEVLLDAILQ